MRIMMSAVLVAFAIFVVQYRKSMPGGNGGAGERATSKSAAKSAAESKTLPSIAPSSTRASRFSWIPSFPGAQTEDIRTKLTHGQLSYGFSFRTSQNFDQVIAFYKQTLEAQGFKVEVRNIGDNGANLHAESGGRTLDMGASKTPEGTEAGVTASEQ
jgi:hypothetical protein